MRTPQRLVATLAATALTWASLTLVVATAEADAASSAGQGDHGRHGDKGKKGNKHRRDAPHDPATYYAGTEGLSGNALALALNAIIDGNTFIPYTASTTDVWDALKVLDRDPNNPNGIIDAYNGDSLDINNQCGSSCALNGWNREHTWAQSRGSFDTAPGPGTDLFHMRPLRGNTNSSRGNKDFDNGGAASVPGCPNCHADGDSFEPISSFKGDLARGLFYMDVRYNGDADDAYGVDLRMWDQVGNSGSQLGKLSTLVAWSLADPPDAGELNRNNLVDGDYQHNRNPFIDHPEWVCAIWGSQVPAATCNNRVPTTAPMSKSTPEDTPTTVALTGSDPDGDTLSWSLSAPAAAHGTAGVTGSTLSYTPAANYNGTDTIGVTVSDGRGGTASTTVTITITAVNDAPTATAQIVSTPQNTAKVITLAATDVDGDTLTFAKASDPDHGSVDVTSGGQATYTPAGGYSGPDSFTFTVNDGSATSAPATVSINVTAAVNHAPSATPQSVSTAEDSSKVISLAGTDSDGDALSYAIGTGPSHGSVSLVGNQATYTPAANYNGPDSFTFTVNDGALTSAAATVSITVTPVNDPPTATVQSVTTDEDTAKVIALAGTDVDGDTLTFAKAGNPAHGTVTITPDGQATYTPAADYAGSDSFTFTVNDGTVTSVAATVSIAVTDVNDTPTATAQSVSTAEDTAKVIDLAGTDVDGDTLTFAKAGNPAHGTVTITPDGQATYTPAADYHGPDSFTFTANDEFTTSAPATVSITVTPVNDAPAATGASVTTAEDTAKVIDLAGTDVDGDTFTFAKASDPAHGTVSITSAGQATYTPAADYTGPDSFTFTVNDGTVTSAPATVTITVDPVDDIPVVTLVTPTATRGKPVTTTVTVTGQSGHPTPSGQVTIKNGATKLGTVPLGAGGTASVTWTPASAGTATLVATYAGDGLYTPATSAPTKVAVARSASVLTFTGTIKKGKPGRIKVAITSVGASPATGTITVKAAGNTYQATLKNGVARFKLAASTKAKVKVRATYAGDSQYAHAKGRNVYVVKQPARDGSPRFTRGLSSS